MKKYHINAEFFFSRVHDDADTLLITPVIQVFAG